MLGYRADTYIVDVCVYGNSIWVIVDIEEGRNRYEQTYEQQAVRDWQI